jgi:hypothetical protein
MNAFDYIRELPSKESQLQAIHKEIAKRNIVNLHIAGKDAHTIEGYLSVLAILDDINSNPAIEETPTKIEAGGNRPYYWKDETKAMEPAQ